MPNSFLKHFQGRVEYYFHGKMEEEEESPLGLFSTLDLLIRTCNYVIKISNCPIFNGVKLPVQGNSRSVFLEHTRIVSTSEGGPNPI